MISPFFGCPPPPHKTCTVWNRYNISIYRIMLFIFLEQMGSKVAEKHNVVLKFVIFFFTPFSMSNISLNNGPKYKNVQGCLGGTRLILDQIHLKNIKVEKNLVYTHLQGFSPWRPDYFFHQQGNV